MHRNPEAFVAKGWSKETLISEDVSGGSDRKLMRKEIFLHHQIVPCTNELTHNAFIS